jgi:hypothetical protein
MSPSLEIIKDKNALEGTVYFEILPGPYKNKCWNEGSLFLDEEAFGFVEPVFERFVENYDHYSFMQIDAKTGKQILGGLNELRTAIETSQAVEELEGIIGFFYRDTATNFQSNFETNRNGLVKMVEELSEWFEDMFQTHQTISLLGL